MTAEFNNKLRDAARALAEGSEEKISIRVKAIQAVLGELKSASNPAGYIRPIMERVPEVKLAGSLSIRKREETDPEHEYFGDTYLDITINRNKKKRVFMKEDIEKAKTEGQRRTVEKVLRMSPNLANYTPDEYALLGKVVAEFHDIIRAEFITEEE